MTRIAIAGAAGRMGRTLIELCQASDTLSLAAAVERPGAPQVGLDPGVLVGGQPVGVVTSGAQGYRTGLTLALCYFRSPVPPTKMTIEILGRDYPARILNDVPFDPANRRVRSVLASPVPAGSLS